MSTFDELECKTQAWQLLQAAEMIQVEAAQMMNMQESKSQALLQAAQTSQMAKEAKEVAEKSAEMLTESSAREIADLAVYVAAAEAAALDTMPAAADQDTASSSDDASSNSRYCWEQECKHNGKVPQVGDKFEAPHELLPSFNEENAWSIADRHTHNAPTIIIDIAGVCL